MVNSLQYNSDVNIATVNTQENILGTPEVKLIKSLTLKYPEMRWLTWNVDATPEATFQANNDKSIWEHVFPLLGKKELIEFNRTAVWIICLYLAYEWTDESYAKFTESQKDLNLRLTRENFNHLHNYTKNIVPNEDDFEALIIYTVINDLWKIHSIIEQIKIESWNEFALKNISHSLSIESIVEYTVRNNMLKIEDIVSMIKKEIWESNVDHDKVLLNGLEKHPQISPSFEELTWKHQSNILTGLRWEFNMGQFLQAENLPANLIKLKWMDENSFNFYMTHFLFDLAWAAWQFVQNGSVIIDNPTYEWYIIWEQILKQYINWEIDELTAYNTYINIKSKKFGINIDNPKNYTLTKLACMIRVKTKEDMENLIDIFETLWENTKAILVKELSKNWVNDWYASLIYYSPALLTNLQSKLWKQEWLKLWLTTLARIFQEARINIKNRKWNGVYTVLIKKIADIAAENPESLRSINFEIKEVWDDAIVNAVENPKIDLSFISNKQTITSIETQIPWKKVVIWWIWGGSDAVQAFQLAKILENNNKEVPFIFSVRTNKTWSQWVDWKIWKKRTPENSTEIYKWVYEINPDTKMKWRAMEPLLSKNIKTYLILMDEWEEVSDKLDYLISIESNIDTVIWVDTWWDALFWSWEWLDNAKSTPDQDLLVLKSMNKIKFVDTVLSCEIAVWIDSPSDAWEVLNDAKTAKYTPTEYDIEQILRYYSELWMDWSSDIYYWKTALAWQEALKNNLWIQELSLPKNIVTDDTNPWNPYVNIQESTKHILFMKVSNHIDAIKRNLEINSLF